MRPARLIFREIAHRKLSFCLGAMSVAVAAACVVGGITLLRGHDILTDQLLSDQQAATAQRLSQLTDDYRKLMLRVGFNVRILPADQDLGDFYDAGFAAKTMDEQLASRLAAAEIITIRHLLPKLQRRVVWPERGRRVLLIGTRGEVPAAFRTDPKKPIVTAIPAGVIDVGHHLGLDAGQSVTFMGREFTVRRSLAEQGTRADITVWMDLATMQELVNLPGRINEIQAVDCRCAWANVQEVRRELQRILPETQVVLTQDTALVRAEARMTAEAEQAAALAQQRDARDRLEARNARLAGVLAPLVVVACGVWVCLLAAVNTRSRRGEVGILRAVGVRARRVFWIFMARSMLMGLAGAAVGCVLGFAAAVFGSELSGGVFASAKALFSGWAWLGSILGAPLLAAAAAWAPALVAAQQDPADVLSEM